MSKHTPGPWRKQGNLIFGAEIGSKICQLYTQHVPGVKSGASEESANARLIAAAVDLLDALIMAFHLIHDGEKFSADHPWNKDDTLKAIKAAITKATSDAE